MQAVGLNVNLTGGNIMPLVESIKKYVRIK
jgi:hypothetical protein